VKDFFSHYRTTIAGLLVGALNLYANGAAPRQVAISVALSLLGLFAKDAGAPDTVMVTQAGATGNLGDVAKAVQASRGLAVLVAVMLLAIAPAHGQVTASFSPQPLEAFKAAFGSKVKGVAVYSVDVCLARTAPAPIDIATAFVTQAAVGKFATINPALNDVTTQEARRHNKKVRAAKWLEEAASLAAVLGAGGVVKVSSSVLTGIVSAIPIFHQAQDYFEGEAPPPAGAFAGSMLSGTLHLSPGSCESRLVLGRYVKGLDAFVAEVK